MKRLRRGCHCVIMIILAGASLPYKICKDNSGFQDVNFFPFEYRVGTMHHSAYYYSARLDSLKYF